MTVLESEYSAFDIDYDAWKRPKPFGISGCFRLCDESEFMVQAIESHLPYLDEALLVTQPSKDNTVELARELAAKHDKVRLIEYPENIYFIDKPEFHTVPDNSIKSFVYLSNYALSQCKYQWVAKTEGDVICLPSFNKICETIKNTTNRVAYYGRVILNIAGENMDKISIENSRNGGADECVIPNRPEFHFVRRDKWEVLIGDIPYVDINFGITALHMKRCKKEHLPIWNGEHYIDLTFENTKKAIRDYNEAHGGYPAGQGWEYDLKEQWQSIVEAIALCK